METIKIGTQTEISYVRELKIVERKSGRRNENVKSRKS